MTTDKAATPRTDALADVLDACDAPCYPESEKINEPLAQALEELIGLSRTLETALTERTEQLAEAREVADSNWKQCVAAAEVEASARKAIQRLADCLALKAPADVVVTAAIDNLTRIIDEKRTAEAEVARLKDLVGRCRAVIAYDSPSAPILTEIDKEINP